MNDAIRRNFDSMRACPHDLLRLFKCTYSNEPKSNDCLHCCLKMVSSHLSLHDEAGAMYSLVVLEEFMKSMETKT